MKAQPYPGYNADLSARQQRLARTERANAAVLPGALRGAFAGEPPKVGNYALQPITLGLTANLERIQSPLLAVLRIMREEITRPADADRQTPVAKAADTANRLRRAHARIAAEIKSEVEALVETAFVFITPPAEVRKLLDQGRDKFREHAMRELGDKLHPALVGELQRACAAHYAASFETVVLYGPPPDKDGSVFTTPPPGAKTDSAGGSTSSAP